MAELSEEIKSLATITRHVRMVQANLEKIARRLEARATSHDISKLSPDEFSGFVKINHIGRDYKYDSPQYRQSLEDNKDLIGLHFQRNSHHPEHYPGGVNDMSLMDIIEMICDWKAACETYNQTGFEESVDIGIRRFSLTPEQIYLVKLIARELED